MTNIAYVCTNCPKGQSLYNQMKDTPHVIETGCLGHCQYTPRVTMVINGDEIYLGSRKIGEPLNIKPLGKNPKATIVAMLDESGK